MVEARRQPTSPDAPGPALIRDLYAAGRAANRPVISIELYPPKTPEANRRLFDETLPHLLASPPDFFSVTYGAGGSTRDRTLEIVDLVQQAYGLTGLAHLTCVGADRAGVRTFLDEAASRGIRNILALHGDPPGDEPDMATPVDGFDYAYEMVDLLRVDGRFSVGVAGFPEGHAACPDGKHIDWQHLREKIDSGADFVLTQLFFENADYFEMRDHLTTELGVTVPITPGILPILGTAQIRRFTALCGASLPTVVDAALDRYGDDAQAVRAYGVDYASRQCEALLAGGAPGLHLYSLNQSDPTLAILRNLGLAGS